MTTANLIKSLIQARKDFKPIQKDRTNSHFKNSYATLDSVLEAVAPALGENGLTVVQSPDIVADRTVLRTTLYHESGEFLESVFPLPDTLKPQELGSAITYARRYSLCAILNVTADEDDDGEATRSSGGNKQSSPAPAKPGVISEKQLQRLYAISNEHGWPKEEAKQLLARFGYASGKDIRQPDYDKICQAFQQRQTEPDESPEEILAEAYN